MSKAEVPLSFGFIGSKTNGMSTSSSLAAIAASAGVLLAVAAETRSGFSMTRGK